MDNYTCAHESRQTMLGAHRIEFPDNHIEVDNRLSWLLGRLEERYGDEAFYVHLTRQSSEVGRSYNRRWDFNESIAKAYADGILMGHPHSLSSCVDLAETVEANIRLFLKAKPNQIKIELEDFEAGFRKFWQSIGAKGELDKAISTLREVHNPSKQKAAKVVKPNPILERLDQLGTSIQNLNESTKVPASVREEFIASLGELEAQHKSKLDAIEAKHKSEIASSKKKTQELAKEIAKLEAHVQKLEVYVQERDALLQSHSWRLGHGIVRTVKRVGQAVSLGYANGPEYQPQPTNHVSRSSSQSNGGTSDVVAPTADKKMAYVDGLALMQEPSGGQALGLEPSELPSFTINQDEEPSGPSSDKPHFVCAVTTINRPQYLRKFVETYRETLCSDFTHTLIVADDGSDNAEQLALLEELANTEHSEHQTIVIRNQGRTIAGQVNEIFHVFLSIDGDFGVKADDDVFFEGKGWQKLYYDAATKSGFEHLVYFNEEWKKPTHELSKSGLSSLTDASNCMGCFYTFTPGVLKKIGWMDSENFKLRGHSHIDFTLRACRAGFNEEHALWDADGATSLVKMWSREEYIDLTDWKSKRVKRILSADERKRRAQLIAQPGRLYIPRQAECALEGPEYQTPNGAARSALTLKGNVTRASYRRRSISAFVLNLDNQSEKWGQVSAGLCRHGIRAQRVQAINGYDEEHRAEWEAYSKTPFNRQERQIGRKLIQSPGAWGYNLTMRKILNEASIRRFDRFITFDDDICPRFDFGSRLQGILDTLPEDFLYVLLGGTLCESTAIKPVSQGLATWSGRIDGSFGVLYSKHAVEPLLESLERMDSPFDSGALRELQEQHPQRCFLVNHNLVLANVSSSTIRQGRSWDRFIEVGGWQPQYHQRPSAISAPVRALMSDDEYIDVIVDIRESKSRLNACIRSLCYQTLGALRITLLTTQADSSSSSLQALTSWDPRICISAFDGLASKQTPDAGFYVYLDRPAIMPPNGLEQAVMSYEPAGGVQHLRVLTNPSTYSGFIAVADKKMESEPLGALFKQKSALVSFLRREVSGGGGLSSKARLMNHRASSYTLASN